MVRVRMPAGARGAAVAGTLAALVAACATSAPLKAPEGPWVPDPGGAAIVGPATAACRGVRAMTAEIAVRGRVGGQRLRGRVLAGFARGGSLRFEAPAPFGAPLFILTARANRGTLWLPRDRRILRDASVADILDAIVGLRRSSDDLLGLLSGCLTEVPPDLAGDARRNSKGWLMAALDGDVTAFFRRDGPEWRLRAGHRDDPAGADSWTVSYDRFTSPFPDLVRITTMRPGGGGAPEVSLSLELSQRETNTTIDPRAFDAVAAPDAAAMTLDEFRRSGPLADRFAGAESGS